MTDCCECFTDQVVQPPIVPPLTVPGNNGITLVGLGVLGLLLLSGVK